jgi:hypothetical protein
MNGGGGGMFSSVGTYLKDPGFWVSVLLVGIGLSIALTVVGAPGYRR